jgi:hypothetical protein
MSALARLALLLSALFLFTDHCFAQALFLSEPARKLRDREFDRGWFGYHLVESKSSSGNAHGSLECLSLSNHEELTQQIRSQPLPRPIQSSTFFSQHLGFQPSSGESLWCFARSDLAATDWLSLRLGVGGGVSAGSERFDYHFEEASLEVRMNRLKLSVGRTPMYWGQSFVSPLVISYNATPLNSVRLATEPVSLPGFMSRWGQFRSEIFWAPLDAERNPAHDHFFGLRLGWKPSERWETNLSLLYQIGGDGEDYDETWSDLLLEFLGARPESEESLATGSASNRIFAFDVRYHFDTAIPLTVYTEQHLEDCCGNLMESWFWEATIKYRYSYVVGAAIKWGGDWDSTLRAEYLRATNLYNLHGKWPSGFSHRGRELGAYSGRDSRVMAIDWEMKPKTVIHFLRAAVYGQEISHYQRAYFEPAGFPITDYEPTFQTSEWRMGGVLESARQMDFLDLQWGAAFGVERIWNRDYQRSASDWTFAGALKAQKNF